MATITLGTNATTTLTAITFASSISAADFATIAQGIRNDKIDVAGSHPILPDAFTRFGKLWVPNRGYLDVLPGDVVAFDSDGWPILVSASSIGYASTDWAHS